MASVNEPALKTFSVRNYRSLVDTTLSELGHVNLLTGKNNAGKSSVLEALNIFLRRAHPSAIARSLVGRDELSIRRPSRQQGLFDDLDSSTAQSVACLFYNRPTPTDFVPPIWLIGDRTLFPNIRMELGFVVAEQDLDDPFAVEYRPVSRELALVTPGAELALKVFEDGKAVREYLESRMTSRALQGPGSPVPLRYITTNGLNRSEVSALWESVALTPSEQEVVEATQLLAPDIERISMFSEPGNAETRIAMAKVRGVPRPVPLKSLGEGFNRLFGIMLALVSAKDGHLLVDEIETGFHYSVQPKVWEVLFTLAERLNVQVFATTHSRDVIEAFARVAQQSPLEGRVYRMVRRNDNVEAVTFTEPELAVATNNDIEVR